MIDFNTTVFIVDGETEISSIKQKILKEFGLIPEFRKSPCNGKDVSVEGYVNAVSGILTVALSSYFTNIICVLDKEKRKVNPTVLANKIKKHIIMEFCSTYSVKELDKKIMVFVPDICFENWIVADIEGIKKIDDIINGDAEQQIFDGRSGINVLCKIMKVKYSKLLHAPKLFKQVSFERAQNNSPSFKLLYSYINSI